MSKQNSNARICIIGLGLIGGSIGMALRAAKPGGVEVIGYDPDASTERTARSRGAIDSAGRDLPDAVHDASVVIIAAPLSATPEVMAQIAPHLAAGSLVTDTGSTKAQVMRWATELLPGDTDFIGGHPMAGKETQGIDHAEAGLFKEKVYCLCPALNASEGSIAAMQSLVQLLGARTLFIDAEEHDQYAAAVSHLPLITSAALFSLVRESPGWREIAPLAASGFRDATRLASGDPQMSYDICSGNREAILHWLDRYLTQLHELRVAISESDPALLEKFTRIKLQRDEFIARPQAQAAASAGAGNEEPAGLDKARIPLRSLFDGARNIGRAPDHPAQKGKDKPRRSGPPEG